ncbi:MAG: hypothetical protein JKY92_04385 [Magnetovibrio sp.]|nr:hypothetical protein [Magnetovibrio sp.]
MFVQMTKALRLSLSISIASAFLGIVQVPSAAQAQNLNQRSSAPPGAIAKKARVLTQARRQAAQSGGGLNHKTVNTDCSKVEIGTQAAQQKGRITQREQIVVIPGDVINICR